MGKPVKHVAVMGCDSCPMCGPGYQCQHPDGKGPIQCDWERGDTKPEWCPLRKGPVAIALRESA